MPTVHMPCRNAEAPFDHPDADVVLQSSDNVNFRVFKLFLSLPSPYFRRRFDELSVSEATGLPADKSRDLQVIKLAVPSATLTALLSFCYPKWSPDADLTTTSDIEAVLTVAKEYEMELVIPQIASALIHPRFENLDPIRMFAIACRFRLVDLANFFAKQSLFIPIRKRTYTPELEHISAASLQHSVDYYFKCSKAAENICSDPDADFPWKVPGVICQFQEGSCCGVTQPPGTTGSVRLWWNDFIRSASSALEQQPRGETVMHPDLMVPVMAKVSSCSVCREMPLKLFLEFRKQYADKVEKVIGEIQPPIES